MDSGREYSQRQEYHFEMKIPADILSAKPEMPELEGGSHGRFGFNAMMLVVESDTFEVDYYIEGISVSFQAGQV
jgi:hypothetical protein